MFKSISYLGCEYDKETSIYTYYYRLADSEFECEYPSQFSPSTSVEVVIPILEYHKRNSKLVENLYLLNNFLLKNRYSNWSFVDLLTYQKDMFYRYFKTSKINFSKDIYPRLLKMHEELSAYG